MQGTGGVRKLRFAKGGENRGKRDSFRVLYVYFKRSGLIALVTAYGKNERANIDNEDKKLFRELATRIEKNLAEGKIK